MREQAYSKIYVSETKDFRGCVTFRIENGASGAWIDGSGDSDGKRGRRQTI